MSQLGELEQLVLLATLRIGADAYGATVREAIHSRAGRDLTVATIYKTLARLEAKGLVTSRVGDPTPERGGRAKRHFAVTAAGQRAVRASVMSLRRMAAGLDVGLETP
jgi:DNA-binding PadR family transcriptional regulator